MSRSHLHRRSLPVIALASLTALIALPLRAQGVVARADSLLREGRIFAAETLYYQAARREPRNPAARLALGRYLASRGALRVGAVLMEEARFFGGDAGKVAVELAPVYARLRDYKALAALPGSPLSSAERARADFLKLRAPIARGPDSVRVPYILSDSVPLGTVRIVLGSDTLWARIEPLGSELVLDTSWASRPSVRTFAPKSVAAMSPQVAVAPLLRMGDLRLENTPTRLEPLGGARAARIGLELLAAYAPTFDPVSGTVTLRRQGRLQAGRKGEEIPTLIGADGLQLVTGEIVTPIATSSLHPALRGAVWTLDSKRGEIIVQR